MTTDFTDYVIGCIKDDVEEEIGGDPAILTLTMAKENKISPEEEETILKFMENYHFVYTGHILPQEWDEASEMWISNIAIETADRWQWSVAGKIWDHYADRKDFERTRNLSFKLYEWVQIDSLEMKLWEAVQETFKDSGINPPITRILGEDSIKYIFKG